MRKGFTLVEVMVVVAIIALLAGLLIPYLLSSRIRANEAATKSALKALATALEFYYNSNSAYPTSTNLLVDPNPPYLNVDYFTGVHNGYTFDPSTLSNSAYEVIAWPQSPNQGTRSFTISTGATNDW